MSVTYTATLPVRDQAVLFVSSLLHAERARRGTRVGRRALSPFKQAILILRWFLDGTRVAQLAVDNAIDRVRIPGPTPGADLWWSGKHANHGGTTAPRSAI